MMKSVQPMNQYLPYINSAERAKLLQNQANFHQSFSGSETDVSTSTENLTHEERYVIKHTQRQEPQGEENLSSCNRSMDASSCNTLIIHSGGSIADDLWSSRNSNIHNIQDTGPPGYPNSSSGLYYQSSQSGSSFVSSNAMNPVDLKMSYAVGGNNSPASPKQLLRTTKIGHQTGQNLGCTPCSYNVDQRVQEITDIPPQYLAQSEVMKHLVSKDMKVPVGPVSSGDKSVSNSSSHLNHTSPVVTDSDSSKLTKLSRKDMQLPVGKEMTPFDNGSSVNYDYSNLPPPPAYPKWRLQNEQGSELKKQSEKFVLSRSQPDLAKVGPGKSDDMITKGNLLTQRPQTSGRDVVSMEHNTLQSSPEMVDILMQENAALKLELDLFHRKVPKMQKFEFEIAKVHQAHEALVKSSERRESLERTARTKLQGELSRLQQSNRSLREQVDLLSSQLVSRPLQEPLQEGEGIRKELNRRDVLIAQLISQNKELVAAKERQEIELAAQRATLQEQRTHIDILDSALTNAQTNVIKLEEECRKKQTYVERVAQLQRALASLQLASNKREQTEKKLRVQMEHEIRELRSQQGETDLEMGTRKKKGCGDMSFSDYSELKWLLRVAEERGMRLEGEVSKWEQRYMEESAMRQVAIDAASIPKDAKIAALEKTSQESEKTIAEAQMEKIRHMDVLHGAQKRCTDLESRIKDLEAKLAEKDAMIKVLHKHGYEKGICLDNMTVHSPHHTPLPSLHCTQLSTTQLLTTPSHSTQLSSSRVMSHSELGSVLFPPGGREKLSTASLCTGSTSCANVYASVTSTLPSSPVPSTGLVPSLTTTGLTSSSFGLTSSLGTSCSLISSEHPALTTSVLTSSPFPIKNSNSYITSSSSSAMGDSPKLTYQSPEFCISSSLGLSGSSSSSTKYTGSQSSGSMTVGTLRESNKSFDDTKKAIDDQLKELDSQLLSKRGLCCFPGFSNSGTAQRKGKISKPLLESVSRTPRGCDPLLNKSSFTKDGPVEYDTGENNSEESRLLSEEAALLNQSHVVNSQGKETKPVHLTGRVYPCSPTVTRRPPTGIRLLPKPPGKPGGVGRGDGTCVQLQQYKKLPVEGRESSSAAVKHPSQETLKMGKEDRTVHRPKFEIYAGKFRFFQSSASRSGEYVLEGNGASLCRGPHKLKIEL